MSELHSKSMISRMSNLESDLMSFQADTTKYPDDIYGIAVCRQALTAIEEMNYGVGCLLIDPSGTIVEQGRNQVFHPYFRSDRHAEMVVLNSFEDHNPEVGSIRDYTLFVSVEPCPMCIARIVMSGVGMTKFLVTDAAGGMADRIHELPTNFIRLSKRMCFVTGDCSPELTRLARDIFALNLNEMRAKLMQR